jgi:hypothetical protein
MPLQPDASTPDTSDAPLIVPTTYSFESRFVPGQSSVAYTGQVFRQVLIAELHGFIGRLTTEIDSGILVPADGQIELALDFYYHFDSTTSGHTPLTISTDPALLQAMFDDIGAANLAGKMAGNDPTDQHKDWTTAFEGWSEGEVQTPEALLQYWFAKLDDLAVDRAQNMIPQGPDGTAITKVYITPQGQDLQQLIQKFLYGAVTLSQGIDDYLDNATEGRGLNYSNLRDGEAAYSALEHAWDEGFGYFGAARDYGDYTDEEIAGAGGRPAYARGYHDSDGDGAIDLRSEYNFGASTNAAKRDLGSAASAPTDFAKAIFDAFLTGRAIISSAEGELDDAQRAALLVQRDIIVQSWEKAISATVVHYINDVLRHMVAFNTVDYTFNDHAKHWSEMKGFALGLQFSPFSPLSDAQFVEMHQLMRDAPVLPSAELTEIGQYRADLLAARAILAQAYGFDPANVGDAQGNDGW